MECNNRTARRVRAQIWNSLAGMQRGIGSDRWTGLCCLRCPDAAAAIVATASHAANGGAIRFLRRVARMRRVTPAACVDRRSRCLQPQRDKGPRERK